LQAIMIWCGRHHVNYPLAMLWTSSTAQSKTATINKSGRLSEKARLA
jgi:hypothetical protein